MIIHVDGNEVPDETSFYNVEEVKAVMAALQTLKSSGVGYDQITVITPYSAQRDRLKVSRQNFDTFAFLLNNQLNTYCERINKIYASLPPACFSTLLVFKYAHVSCALAHSVSVFLHCRN